MFLVAYTFLVTGQHIICIINCLYGRLIALMLCMEWPDIFLG